MVVLKANEKDYVVHLDPVRRDKSDFIIMAKLDGGPPHYEQLWVKKITNNQFELCCIPLAVYDIALGDIVETSHDPKLEYVVSKVVKKSNHKVFRVWLAESSQKKRRALLDDLRELGVKDMEFYSTSLLAIDASNRVLAGKIKKFLIEKEKGRELEYENGETKIDF